MGSPIVPLPWPPGKGRFGMWHLGRLGMGDWSAAATIENEARDAFLTMVKQVAPQVLVALRDGGALRAYQHWLAEYEICREPEGWQKVVADYREQFGPRVHLGVAHHLLPWPWSRVRDAGGDWFPDFLRIKNALLAWAERFNLGEAHLPDGDWWALDAALDTLRQWATYPPAAALLEWCGPAVGGWVPIQGDEQRLVFEHPGWDPAGFGNHKTWADFENRVMSDFRAYLAAYKERMEALARERGLRPTPTKRDRGGSPLLHFEWLVRYQVQRLGCEDIAQQFTDADPTGTRVIGADAVRKAIAETARLVGLKLRK